MSTYVRFNGIVHMCGLFFLVASAVFKQWMVVSLVSLQLATNPGPGLTLGRYDMAWELYVEAEAIGQKEKLIRIKSVGGLDWNET